MILDVWQAKELEADFSDVWQAKEIEEVKVKEMDEVNEANEPAWAPLRHGLAGSFGTQGEHFEAPLVEFSRNISQ